MDKSFYKKEAASLQSLFEKYKSIATSTDITSNPSQNHRVTTVNEAQERVSKDGIIVGAVLFLLVIGTVGFLTVWLVN